MLREKDAEKSLANVSDVENLIISCHNETQRNCQMQ